MRFLSVRYVLPALAIVVGCSQPSNSNASALGSSTQPSQAVPASSRATFGAPLVSQESVALSELAREPARYQSRTIVISGTVVDVCQHRGCWMVVEQEGHQARIRMRDHSFFVPRDSKGRAARVQGQLTGSGSPAPQPSCQHKKPGEPRDCEPKPGEIAFEATGVELH